VTLATLPLSVYLSVWSRNEGEVLRMAEQTATAAPQTDELNFSNILTYFTQTFFVTHLTIYA
jgi:hypothetical protein